MRVIAFIILSLSFGSCMMANESKTDAEFPQENKTPAKTSVLTKESCLDYDGVIDSADLTYQVFYHFDLHKSKESYMITRDGDKILIDPNVVKTLLECIDALYVSKKEPIECGLIKNDIDYIICADVATTKFNIYVGGKVNQKTFFNHSHKGHDKIIYSSYMDTIQDLLRTTEEYVKNIKFIDKRYRRFLKSDSLKQR